jgi:isoleucyl-tRNA synthetase
MHKSGGNVISPLDLIKDYGAEIIRLWVAGEDYRDNIRLSDEILQRLTEAYRRIRNTCRYLLGNLSDFDPKRDSVPYEELEELDRWALHRLHEMSERVRKAYTDFEFHPVYHNLHNFCVLDLSSFYLDIIKDRLYVSAQDSPARRSAQTAMHEILAVLVRLMAPVLCFTADEIWRFMPDAEHTLSVHMDLFVPVKEQYKDPDLASRWEEIIKVRREVTKALEIARKEKQIGHSLDARVILGLPEDLRKRIDPYREQLPSLFIVSAVQLVPSAEVEGGFESEELDSVKIKVTASTAPKCERCWVRDPTVGEDDAHPLICDRCLQAIDGVKDLDT